ncbi:MAG: ABC transporter ATP-binding protein [Bacillota bacterium]
MPAAIEMKNINKNFSGVQANQNIDFTLAHNEVHCLLGENGAGKSTLMNILFGMYKADSGEIYLNGEKASWTNPMEAIKYGLGMVHQHFMLVNRLTVLENIVLGSEKLGLFWDKKAREEEVAALANHYNFNIDLKAKIEDLSVGMKQRVEILKTLYRGADIIILDEPTAVLTSVEVEELFNIIDDLIADGKSIVFITHKLNETMKISDRVTVLRSGQKVKTLKTAGTDPGQLAELMVGREIRFTIDKEATVFEDKIIEVENLCLRKNQTNPLDFTIQAGEILGIAGVQGNGQMELEEILMGMKPASQGRILFTGRDLTRASTHKRRELGMGFIPSDRQKRGILPDFSIEENMILGYHRGLPYSGRFFLKKNKITEITNQLIKDYDIRTPNSKKKIGQLSGGNQQKVMVSKEISRDPEFILAAQPTAGLDVGSIEYIHDLLIEMREAGKAILLISSELDEILKLADRVAVIYEGEFKAIRPTAEFDRQEIGLLMSGREAK